MTRRRARDGDRGSAVVEFVWLAILLLVPLLYIVLAVFETQRAAFAVTAASRAAGRAYALSPTEAAALGRARSAAALALEDQGLADRPMSLTVTCTPDPGNCLAPGSVISVDLACSVSLPLMPSALGGNTPSIRVEGLHRVPYGTFREDRP